MSENKVYKLTADALERVTFVEEDGDVFPSIYLNGHATGVPLWGFSLLEEVLEEVKPPAPSVEDVYRALGGAPYGTAIGSANAYETALDLVQCDPDRARKIVATMEGN